MIFYKLNGNPREQYYENTRKLLERFDGYAFHYDSDNEFEYYINESYVYSASYFGKSLKENNKLKKDVI